MKADRLIAELLLEKLHQREQAPKKPATHKRELTIKQIVKVAKLLPEIKKELDDAMKALEKKDDKPKDKLTIGQRYMAWTLAAAFIPPLYVSLIYALFSSIVGK